MRLKKYSKNSTDFGLSMPQGSTMATMMLKARSKNKKKTTAGMKRILNYLPP